jgi:hypothetical protein
MSAPYFVALCNGFVQLDDEQSSPEDQVRFTIVHNVRLATCFNSFQEADDFGNWAVEFLPRGLRYFAILQSTIGGSHA